MTIELPLYVQGGTYPARLDRFITAELWDEGVKTPTACKVTQRGAGANFTVDVAVGSFLIAGDDQALQGTYQGRITAIETGVTIGAAPAGANKRIDLVTLRVNDPNAGGNSGNTVTVVVVAGTQTTGTPVAPALPASSIPLCTVGPIVNGTASITNSLITDARYIAGRKAPVGTMELIAGVTPSLNIPNGWLYCAGQAVSRTTYADLFAILGTAYGVGDGSTTFNVPNLLDRVPVAIGSTFTTAGATGGEVNHTLSTGEMPSHGHTYSGTTDVEGATHTHAPSAGSQFVVDGTPTAVSAGSGVTVLHNAGRVSSTSVESLSHQHAFSGTAVSTGGGGGHNNMQPYQVVQGWMIRT